jgi:cytidylate kinase
MFKIVTISREFGSAGKTIAKRVAERLGYVYYDKALNQEVAKQTGFDETFVDHEGAYAPGKSQLSMLLASRGTQGILNGMSLSDYLWSVQQKVILELAEKESCVIAGRCAEFILKDRKDCLSVFIHASMEDRIARISRHHKEQEERPEKLLETRDKKRRAFYKYYTNLEWGLSQNYHLTLDSGVLGIRKCVDLIVDLAKNPVEK